MKYLVHLKQLFLDWFYGTATRELSAIERYEADKRAAFEKAIATLLSDDQACFFQTLKLARSSGNWERYSSILMGYIESMSADHQVVAMGHIISESPAFTATLGFARWARNNSRHMLEIHHDGGMRQFYSRVAAA
jgi:hypothetical protein